MIYYRTDGVHSLLNIFRWSGSVYPTACAAALPCACMAAVLRAFLPIWNEDSSWVLSNSSLWASFSSLLGFLVVFRTSQAYNRFWTGCTALHRIKADWFDACSALVAFCKFSTDGVPPEKVLRFEHTIVRLFSMLYALALAEIEDCSSFDSGEVRAFGYEFVGGSDLDLDTIFILKDSECKVELVYQWIQQLIVSHIGTLREPNVLSIPPPILTRVFQLLSNGMNSFHEGIQVSTCPFPFPYAQCCHCLLAIHWMLVPLVACGWSPSWWLAFVFAFLQVFILWSLNTIAIEIENPFGKDANDLDSKGLQLQMNQHLECLLDGSTTRTPSLSAGFSVTRQRTKSDMLDARYSIRDIWDKNPRQSVQRSAPKRRKSTWPAERGCSPPPSPTLPSGGWMNARRSRKGSCSHSASTGDLPNVRSSGSLSPASAQATVGNSMCRLVVEEEEEFMGRYVVDPANVGGAKERPHPCQPDESSNESCSDRNARQSPDACRGPDPVLAVGVVEQLTGGRGDVQETRRAVGWQGVQSDVSVTIRQAPANGCNASVAGTANDCNAPVAGTANGCNVPVVGTHKGGADGSDADGAVPVDEPSAASQANGANRERAQVRARSCQHAEAAAAMLALSEPALLGLRQDLRVMSVRSDMPQNWEPSSLQWEPIQDYASSVDKSVSPVPPREEDAKATVVFQPSSAPAGRCSSEGVVEAVTEKRQPPGNGALQLCSEALCGPEELTVAQGGILDPGDDQHAAGAFSVVPTATVKAKQPGMRASGKLPTQDTAPPSPPRPQSQDSTRSSTPKVTTPEGTSHPSGMGSKLEATMVQLLE